MIWIIFLICSAVIVFASTKLAEYGDIISIRTGLGGMFIGLVLMAGATSLPEFLTTLNAIQLGIPNLAAGNIFGSNMFNMFLLGCLGFISFKTRILRKVARRHALSGSISVLLIALGVFFIMADIDISIGWVGLDSIILIIAYIIGLRIIQSNSMPVDLESELESIEDEDLPGLPTAIFGFILATFALVFVMPKLVSVSGEIAEITGLGTGFIGTALVGVVTSLAEVSTTIAAIRQKVYDMAIGNLFGSNMFNMVVLGFTDFFMLDGRFLGTINQDFILIGLIGLLMTIMGLVGNLARLERRMFFLERDALLIVLTYIFGMILVYTRHIGG